jgi:hypothetical protein
VLLIHQIASMHASRAGRLGAHRATESASLQKSSALSRSASDATRRPGPEALGRPCDAREVTRESRGYRPGITRESSRNLSRVYPSADQMHCASVARPRGREEKERQTSPERCASHARRIHNGLPDDLRASSLCSRVCLFICRSTCPRVCLLSPTLNR